MTNFVYVVNDSDAYPCQGLIAGVFSTKKEADAYRNQLMHDGPRTFLGPDGEDCYKVIRVPLDRRLFPKDAGQCPEVAGDNPYASLIKLVHGYKHKTAEEQQTTTCHACGHTTN